MTKKTPVISTLKPLKLSELSGVTIYPLHGQKLRRGVPQEVLVVVEPNGRIPLHSHETDAYMTITGGSGIVLSTEPEGNLVEVKPGNCVFYEKFKMHGFRAGPQGLAFISRNGGIVAEKGQSDIVFDRDLRMASGVW